MDLGGECLPALRRMHLSICFSSLYRTNGIVGNRSEVSCKAFPNFIIPELVGRRDIATTR